MLQAATANAATRGTTVEAELALIRAEYSKIKAAEQEAEIAAATATAVKSADQAAAAAAAGEAVANAPPAALPLRE